MWVLIIVFARLSVADGITTSVTTQEFTSIETCTAAKQIVQAPLGSDTKRLDEFIRQRVQGGTLGGVQSVIFKVECTKK
jgi:hypothetical protein